MQISTRGKLLAVGCGWGRVGRGWALVGRGWGHVGHGWGRVGWSWLSGALAAHAVRSEMAEGRCSQSSGRASCFGL